LTQSQRAQAIAAQAAQKQGVATPASAPAVAAAVAAPTQATTVRKLSYKEQRELDGLPALIESLEKEQAEARRQLADGSIYQRDAGLAQQLFKRDAEIDDLLMNALERWEILSAR
jgi:ATP-binding cassette subfamily F protein uup